uniref:Uncharacterized protein n=1 Tax=Arundo donax TaxID=35708 RepID=A0A0A8Z6A5_ARUDO
MMSGSAPISSRCLLSWTMNLTLSSRFHCSILHSYCA